MIQGINCVIISDEPYTNLSMHLLLAKDWRTRVSKKYATVQAALNQKNIVRNADFILCNLTPDNDLRYNPDPLRMFPNQKVILLINSLIKLKPSILMVDNLAGVLDRNEINLGLAWAVDFANQGYFVTTPRPNEVLNIKRRITTKELIILSNFGYSMPFSRRQKEAIIMNIILGLDHRKTAKEMGITQGSSYGLISSIYQRMEIDGLLKREFSIDEFIPGQKLISEKVENLCDSVKKNGSTHISEKLDLVFHILTCPEIIK